MRDNLIPVEMLDISTRVQAMAWEPRGDRFAVVHGDAGTPSVSIYTMKGVPPGAPKNHNGKELLLLKTLEQRQCSHLYARAPLSPLPPPANTNHDRRPSTPRPGYVFVPSSSWSSLSWSLMPLIRVPSLPPPRPPPAP